ncbi:MAG TPA: hypothetical protein VGY77_03195 [Gemmataceae bacterium]|nr:hypothetical protein [Gemmataceae bacterium]
MSRWRCPYCLSFLALVFFGIGLAPAADKVEPGKVEIKVVKYDGLKDIIKQFKGKVVVVDFWADT